MESLRLTATWPVPHSATACVLPAGSVETFGDCHRSFELASVSKLITTWAILIAVEEGVVALDQPLDQAVGQPGCTLRHLLAHAGGYPFDGPDPIVRPGSRRIYSNRGIEIAADAVSGAAGMPFDEYLRESVLEPLGMTATVLHGSPAHGMSSTVADLVLFVGEVRGSRLLHPDTVAAAGAVQFPGLNGVLPGFGTFRPCPWGLGFEVRGDKQPHWTATACSPRTIGHFGGAGTFVWMDPERNVACLALTDRPFDEWADDARRLWPAFGDAVLAEARG